MPSGASQRNDDIDALYREHRRELWALFYAQCSDPERAYDAVQEAFLKLHLYDGEVIRDQRAWLLHVGRNWLRDVARRKSSANRLMPAMDDLQSAHDDPTERLLTHENRQHVRDALKELKEDDRKVLVLRYSLGWSSNQIAQAMVSTPPAIDMRLSRARKRLAEILEERGINDEQS